MVFFLPFCFHFVHLPKKSTYFLRGRGIGMVFCQQSEKQRVTLSHISLAFVSLDWSGRSEKHGRESVARQSEKQRVTLTWVGFGEEMKRIIDIAGPMVFVTASQYMFQVVAMINSMVISISLKCLLSHVSCQHHLFQSSCKLKSILSCLTSHNFICFGFLISIYLTTTT